MIEDTVSQRRVLDSERQRRENEEQRRKREVWPAGNLLLRLLTLIRKQSHANKQSTQKYPKLSVPSIVPCAKSSSRRSHNTTNTPTRTHTTTRPGCGMRKSTCGSLLKTTPKNERRKNGKEKNVSYGRWRLRKASRCQRQWGLQQRRLCRLCKTPHLQWTLNPDPRLNPRLLVLPRMLAAGRVRVSRKRVGRP